MSSSIDERSEGMKEQKEPLNEFSRDSCFSCRATGIAVVTQKNKNKRRTRMPACCQNQVVIPSPTNLPSRSGVGRQCVREWIKLFIIRTGIRVEGEDR